MQCPIACPFQPPIYGAYLYDAVYQYAVALNKTMARDQAITGKTIVEKLKGIQYDSEYAIDLWTITKDLDLNSPNFS